METRLPILPSDHALAHFAAQFRAATGLRPREYLLRRRIERAQVNPSILRKKDVFSDVRLKNRTGEPGRYICAPGSRFSLRQV
jgi:hypothetical protein